MDILNVTLTTLNGKIPVSVRVKEAMSNVCNGLNYEARQQDLQYNQVLLSFAILYGSVKKIHIYLKEESDLFVKDEKGCTALHWACTRNVRIMRAILAKFKIPINPRCNVGSTPLHRAAEFWNAKCIKYLVQLGHDINVQDKKGVTPLFIAARFTNFKLIRAEIDNSKSYVELQESTVSTLLELGADVSKCTVNGSSIMQAAGANKTNDLVWKMLIRHICKLEIMNIPHGKENIQIITRDAEFDAYYQKCKKELDCMSDIKYGAITLLKILTKSIDVIVGFARNVNLCAFFKAYKCVECEDCPEYQKEIIDRFERGLNKLKRLERLTSILEKSHIFFANNCDITYEILRYLSLDDLCMV